MSVRNKIIRQLGNDIPYDDAELIAKDAGVERQDLGDFDTSRQLWNAVVDRLAQTKSTGYWEAIFDAARERYPKTVTECELLLAAGEQPGDDQPEPEEAPARRTIQIVERDSVDPITWARSSGTLEVTARISMAQKNERRRPTVVVNFLHPDDSVRADPAQRSPDNLWWHVDLTITTKGLRARELEIAVSDHAASRTRFTIFNALISYVAIGVFAVATVISSLAIWVSLSAIPNQGWAAVLGLIPSLPLLATLASIAKPELALQRFLQRPRNLFLMSAVVFGAMWLPGVFFIAVENAMPGEVPFGRSKLSETEWVTVDDERIEKERSRYCITPPERALGLDLVLPRSFITQRARVWTVLADNHGFFGSEIATLVVTGGAFENGKLTQRLDSSCKPTSASARISFGDATVHIPYGWTASVINENETRVIKYTREFGEPLTTATTLVATTNGKLGCEVNVEFVVEPVVVERANEVILIANGPGMISKWESAPHAWRCRIPGKETTSSNLVIRTASNDFDYPLPANLGKTSLKIDGVTVDVPANVRWSIRKRVRDPGSTVPSGTFPLDNGGLAHIDANALIAVAKDPAKLSFKKGGFTFDVDLAGRIAKIDRHEVGVPVSHTMYTFCYYVRSGGATKGPCVNDAKPAGCTLSHDQQRLADRTDKCKRYKLVVCRTEPRCD